MANKGFFGYLDRKILRKNQKKILWILILNDLNLYQICKSFIKLQLFWNDFDF